MNPWSNSLCTDMESTSLLKRGKPYSSKKTLKTTPALLETAKEALQELKAFMEALNKADEWGERKVYFRSLASKMKKIIYSRHEFYLYRTRPILHPMIKMPGNLEIRTGKPEDLERERLSKEARNIISKLESGEKTLVIVEDSSKNQKKVAAFSWVTRRIPEDLRRFYEMKDSEIYTRFTYIEKEFRGMGLLENIIRFRDRELIKKGIDHRLALVDTQNERMIKIFNKIGEKPVAILKSLKVLGLIKIISLKELNEDPTPRLQNESNK